MRAGPRPWLSALLILPAACSGERGKDGGPVSNRAAAANAAATPADAAAAAPCPYRTRNWRMTVGPSEDQAGGGPTVRISQEVHPDAQGRYPMISMTERAPELVLDMEPDPLQSPQAGGDWMEVGSSWPYDPAFAHVVVRCAGREVTRLPMPRPR